MSETGNKWLKGCGAAVGLFLVLGLAGVMYLGVMITRGDAPDSMVVRGGQLKIAARKAIAKYVQLRPDERIKFFYCSGFSFDAGGSVITDQRLISYETDEPDFSLSEVDYKDIDEVEPYYSKGWGEESMLHVVPASGHDLSLILGAEDGNDRVAIDYVLKQIRTIRMAKEKQADVPVADTDAPQAVEPPVAAP